MRALISGSFDPITVGHEDLIIRAASIFDEVVVCAFENSAKHYMYNSEERFEQLRAVAEQYDNVIADISRSMVADYAEENKIDVIVRGSRSGSAFEYELTLAAINREFVPQIDTIVFPARSELSHISSTMVRELIKYGKDYKPYVPKAIWEML